MRCINQSQIHVSLWLSCPGNASLVTGLEIFISLIRSKNSLASLTVSASDFILASHRSNKSLFSASNFCAFSSNTFKLRLVVNNSSCNICKCQFWNNPRKRKVEDGPVFACSFLEGFHHVKLLVIRDLYDVSADQLVFIHKHWGKERVLRGQYSRFNCPSACCNDDSPASRDFIVCKWVFWFLYSSATCALNVVVSSLKPSAAR